MEQREAFGERRSLLPAPAHDVEPIVPQRDIMDPRRSSRCPDRERPQKGYSALSTLRRRRTGGAGAAAAEVAADRARSASRTPL